jgi:preprotein translocase subunit SecA
MLDSVKQEVTRVVMNVQIQSPEQLEEAAEQYEERGSHLANVSFQHADFTDGGAPAAAVAADATAQMINQAMAYGDDTTVATRVATDDVPKVGRNDPCPCGSGKKYKNCHGKLA